MFKKKSGKFIRHEPCPECGSSDNLSIYSDGWYCESVRTGRCTNQGKYPDGGAPSEAEETGEISGRDDHARGAIPFCSLSEPVSKIRGILPSTFSKFHSGINDRGEVTFGWLANDARVKAQHVRSTGNEKHKQKKMPWIGSPEDLMLFGQHLWNGKRYLIIVVGEFDALTAHQAGYACGSAQSDGTLVASLSRNVSAITAGNFAKVIIAVENDESGAVVRAQAAQYLHSVGVSVALANMPGEMDLNDILVEGGLEAVKKVIFDTVPYHSRNIARPSDIRDRIIEGTTSHIEAINLSPFKKMCPYYLPGNVMVIGANTGMGKTALMQRMCFLADSPRVWIGLEETPDESLLGFLSMRDGLDYSNASPDMAREIENWEIPGLFLHACDSFKDAPSFLQSVRSSIRETEAKIAFIDHITYLSYSLGNDVALIDMAMVGLHEVAKQEHVQIVVGSQITNNSKDDPDGLTFSMARLRGSGSISQTASVVVGLSAPSRDATFRFIHFTKNRPFRKVGDQKLTIAELKGINS